ncbi:Disease resistance protein L6 [Linum perenne]
MVEPGNGGHSIILPVFYMMDPRDVRYQTESYAEAFKQHSRKYDVETIQQWKDALQAVGKLKGWHFTNSQPQGATAREIFSCARSHLMKNYPLVTEKLVGIEHHVEQVIDRLNQGVQVVGIVGIVGMGGLGKTTMAMAVTDEVYKKFEYRCFLRDVTKTLSENGGIVALQKQVIFDVTGDDGNVQDASQGIRVIKDRVSKHKVLIIIDDADKGFEFNQILGEFVGILIPCRFIITTRNKQVLQVFRQKEVYEPELLDPEESLQLFSMHAFGFDNPPEGFVSISKKFVQAATLLPLALKIIGTSLFRRDERFWVEKLEQLKKIPHDDVQKRLSITMDV